MNTCNPALMQSHTQQFSVAIPVLLISQTSSAADLGQRDRVMGRGRVAGACAQGIWNSFTTRWLITASTPANTSIPCRKKNKVKIKITIR